MKQIVIEVYCSAYVICRPMYIPIAIHTRPYIYMELNVYYTSAQIIYRVEKPTIHGQ